MTTLLTPKEAGIELARLRRRAKPFHSTYIRKLIRTKKLIAQHTGNNWIISLADLEAFNNQHIAKQQTDTRSVRYYK